MNSQIFAEWLRRQGHRVVHTESASWFDRAPRALMAFPWHRMISPSEEELRDLLRREKAAALRFTAPIEHAEGALSYDVVFEGDRYDLENISRASRRKDIRSGLERCEILPLTFDRYAREGWVLEAETRERQGRASRGGKEAWEKLCGAAAGLDGFEAWGATVEGRLATSVMVAHVDDCATIMYQQSLRELWPLHVNVAFMFSVTRMLRARPGVRMIHYGLHGLDAPSTLDDFKLHLGYARRPVRERVAFHPFVAPLVTPATYALLRAAHGVWSNPVLAKGEGLVRVFLEGRQRPLPDALSSPSPRTSREAVDAESRSTVNGGPGRLLTRARSSSRGSGHGERRT